MNRFKFNLGKINPFFLIIIGIIIFDNLTKSSMSIGEWFYSKILLLPAIFIGISFHEAAHAYASYFLGDPTPKNQGRVTINPLSHIEPIGLLALFVAGFGWGRPVEIDSRYYKKPRLYEFIVSIAGVTVNFIIAVIFALLCNVLIKSGIVATLYGEIIIEIVTNIIAVNAILMIFNLLPIPPLDGFGIITEIFNLKKYSWYYTVYRNGFLILMICIIFDITDFILQPAYQLIMKFMATLMYF